LRGEHSLRAGAELLDANARTAKELVAVLAHVATDRAHESREGFREIGKTRSASDTCHGLRDAFVFVVGREESLVDEAPRDAGEIGAALDGASRRPSHE